ncbi:hypothetical protein IEQ34_000161 [Dendrobium chrysotoxum]|uniref:Uncharacterized protein n=1 Tax=Dendrobium chrysotoxum TaxID=161865 RepID=A0AAV7HS47_DENCH|nr:hypothetical protein IEQ34_000161 [Dendrobium chrysotoxum]
MEVVRNNLYEPRDNLSLALEMNEVVISDWEVEVTGYCYAYMMPCWVPVSMEFIRNNLYEPMNNPKRSVPTSVAMDLLEVVKECDVDVKLELSLALSSGEVECNKWVRVANEIIVMKKYKMEEGPMPYCLHIMLTIFIGAKGYFYAYMMAR